MLLNRPMVTSGTSGSSTDLIQRQDKAKRDEMTTILIVMFISTLWSILTTSIPVFVKTIGSNNLHPEYDGWYRGSDIIRYAEPVGGLFFSYWIFHASGFLNYDARSFSFNHLITMIYVFGVSLYMQGGAFHSASNMFKHGVQIYLDDYLPVEVVDTSQEEAQREYMEDFLYWMRTVWQHIVAHYIYAVGAVIMQVCTMVAYRDHILKFRDVARYQPSEEMQTICSSSVSSDSSTRATPPQRRTSPKPVDPIDVKSVTMISRLVLVNGAVYSLLLSSVAINFPSGLIVGFIYFPLFLISVSWYLRGVGFWKLRKTENWRICLSTRPVMSLYVIAYCLAVLITLLWVAAAGGLKKRSDA